MKSRPLPSPSTPIPGRKLISFCTANIVALVAPARQKCKQQQVSQRSQKRIFFCSLKSWHDTCSAKVISEKERFSSRGLEGGEGGGRFQNKDFLIWWLPKSYYVLTRREQVTVFRLRTGHNRLNDHLCSKPRIGHTEQCPCGTGCQTTEHMLQSCPIYESLRKGIWPDHTPVTRKLYGSLRDRRCTATFVEETGASI